MKYIVKGNQRFRKDVPVQDVESFNSIEDAEREIRKMRIDHPSWIFWISEEENGKEIQESVCSEPELQVRSGGDEASR